MFEYSPLFVCASFSPITGLPQQNSARVHRLRPVTPFAMHNRRVRGDKKVEPVWVQKEVMRYEIVESSSPGHRGGRPGKRLLLRLQHDVQGNMNFVVSDSHDGLFYARSRDHLDSVMANWDEALICADGNLMKSQLEPAERYPEVYVLICVDLLSTKFAQTAVGQQYKTRQQRADLLCPFSEAPTSLRPEDDHSRKIIRFTDSLNDSVMRRAVSSIIAAPFPRPCTGR